MDVKDQEQLLRYAGGRCVHGYDRTVVICPHCTREAHFLDVAQRAIAILEKIEKKL